MIEYTMLQQIKQLFINNFTSILFNLIIYIYSIDVKLVIYKIFELIQNMNDATEMFKFIIRCNREAQTIINIS